MRLEKKDARRWWPVPQSHRCPKCQSQLLLVGIDCIHHTREKAEDTIEPYSGCCIIHLGWLCTDCGDVYINPKPFATDAGPLVVELPEGRKAQGR